MTNLWVRSTCLSRQTLAATRTLQVAVDLSVEKAGSFHHCQDGLFGDCFLIGTRCFGHHFLFARSLEFRTLWFVKGLFHRSVVWFGRWSVGILTKIHDTNRLDIHWHALIRGST